RGAECDSARVCPCQGAALRHTDCGAPESGGGTVSPRRDRQRTSAPRNGARKPYTRASSAQKTGRQSLSRRLSEGDPRSDQHPARRIPVGLSTSSVFPAGVEECFKLAARSEEHTSELQSRFD